MSTETITPPRRRRRARGEDLADQLEGVSSADARPPPDPRQLDVEEEARARAQANSARWVSRSRAEQQVLVSDIDESAHNSRQVFRDLEELAASMAGPLGQLQAIMVRALPMAAYAARARYEVVFGARRLRAARLLGWETIRAVVVDMDEISAAEARALENNQRSDLHPLEQAADFARLAELGRTTEQIAGALGRSVEYVQKRQKLLQLQPEAREAFLDGRMDVALALIIARIGWREGQLAALEALVPPPASPDAKPGEVANESVATTRGAAAWVRKNIFLRLAGAQFAVAEPALVPSAGSCLTCPRNTEASPALFDDIVSDTAMCTDRACWRSKQDADFAARQVAWDGPVLDAAQAAELKIFETWREDNATRYTAPFVGVEESPSAIGQWDSKRKTIRALLPSDAPLVLAQSPVTGDSVVLVSREYALALGKGKGKAPEPQLADEDGDAEDPVRAHEVEERARKDKDRERQAVEEATRKATLGALVDVASNGAFSVLVEDVVRLIVALEHDGDAFEALDLLGVRVSPPKGGWEADFGEPWAAATRTCSARQVAALLVAGILARRLQGGVVSSTMLAEVERVFPGFAAARDDAVAGAVKAARASAKARSKAAAAGGKAKGQSQKAKVKG